RRRSESEGVQKPDAADGRDPALGVRDVGGHGLHLGARPWERRLHGGGALTRRHNSRGTLRKGTAALAEMLFRRVIVPLSKLLVARDRFRKPVPTFWDNALARIFTQRPMSAELGKCAHHLK